MQESLFPMMAEELDGPVMARLSMLPSRKRCPFFFGGGEVKAFHAKSPNVLLEVDGCRCWIPKADWAFEAWWFEFDRNFERLPDAWAYSPSRETVLCQNDVI